MIPSSVYTNLRGSPGVTSRNPSGVLKTNSLGPRSRQKGIPQGHWLNARMPASDLASVQ